MKGCQKTAAATFLVCALGSFWGCAKPVAADDILASPEACQLVSTTESFDAFAKMPRDVQRALRTQLERSRSFPRKMPAAWYQIAERGTPYNFSDVADDQRPHQRFVQGGRKGNRWFVWYEQGGFTTLWFVSFFDLPIRQNETQRVSVVDPNLSLDICAMIDRMLLETPK